MSKKKNATKKSNGQGSITTRGDGRIMARYTYNGKRQTIYGQKGETEADVRKRLSKILLEIDAGSFVEPSQITLEQYLSDWLKIYMYPTIRRSTYSSYEQYVKRHIAPKIGNIKMKDLSKRELQIFFNEKAEGGRLDGKPGGLSVKTLTNMYNMLYGALKEATLGDKPIISTNPIIGVKLGKRLKKDVEVLSVSEQITLQQAALASADPQAFGIIFAVNTGLRIGELLGLKWSDVDFVNHIIKVQRTVQRLPKRNFDPEKDSGPATEVVVGDPKTASSKRYIPLFQRLWDGLMEYRDKQELMRRVAGDAYCDSGFIFCNALGGIIEPRTYEDVFKRCTKVADIKANFHMLRHTFATRALEAGMDIKVLSGILGHSNISITYDTYIHLQIEHKKAGMEKMDSYYYAQPKELTEQMEMIRRLNTAA